MGHEEEEYFKNIRDNITDPSKVEATLLARKDAVVKSGQWAQSPIRGKNDSETQYLRDMDAADKTGEFLTQLSESSSFKGDDDISKAAQKFVTDTTKQNREFQKTIENKYKEKQFQRSHAEQKELYKNDTSNFINPMKDGSKEKQAQEEKIKAWEEEKKRPKPNASSMRESFNAQSVSAPVPRINSQSGCKQGAQR